MRCIFPVALVFCLVSSPTSAAEGIDTGLADFLNSNVVSATRTSQSLREAPAIIDVLTDRDLKERQCASVAEALRTVPGFSLLYDYTTWNAGVRGINGGLRGGSRIIKVMINNQPTALRTDATNVLGPELIPVDLIKRIEIIRGPGSALYGADAFLGVINIVTKSGADLGGGDVAVRGTSFARGGVQGSASAGDFWGAFGQTLDAAGGASLGIADRSGLTVADTSPLKDTFSGQTTAGDLNRPGSAYANVSVGSEALGTLSLAGSYQRLDTSGKFQDWSIGQKTLDSQNRLIVDNGFLRGGYQKAFGSNLLLNLAGAWVGGGPNADDRLDITKPYYFQQRRSGYQGLDTNADLLWRFSDRDSLSLGADYTQTEQRLQSIFNVFRQDFGSNKAGDVKLEGIDQGSRTFANTGVFAQGIYYPLDRLGLTGNLRFDQHNVYGSVWNYRAGAVYLWNDAITSKLLYGTSFKAPSPLQLFSSPIVVGDAIGNPDLKPERAQTVETELSWVVTPNLVVAASGYVTQVQDQVTFVRSGSNFQARNLATASTLGIESSLRWSWAPLHGFVNGTLQSTSAVQQEHGIYQSQDPRSELFPSLLLNAGVVAPLPWLPLDAYVEARYTGGIKPSESNFIQNGGQDYEVPAAAILDVGLTSRNWQLFGRPLTLAGKVTNLLDGRLIHPGFAGIDIPGEGRAFRLTLSQQF
jgi:iron complex outermembrane receptor protein